MKVMKLIYSIKSRAAVVPLIRRRGGSCRWIRFLSLLMWCCRRSGWRRGISSHKISELGDRTVSFHTKVSKRVLSRCRAGICSGRSRGRIPLSCSRSVVDIDWTALWCVSFLPSFRESVCGNIVVPCALCYIGRFFCWFTPRRTSSRGAGWWYPRCFLVHMIDICLARNLLVRFNEHPQTERIRRRRFPFSMQLEDQVSNTQPAKLHPWMLKEWIVICKLTINSTISSLLRLPPLRQSVAFDACSLFLHSLSNLFSTFV